MGDSFGARARKFMGWYTPDDTDVDVDDVFEADEMAEVTPLAAVPRETDFARTQPAVAQAPSNELSRIVTVHPDSYNDVLPIGEAFRKGVPVILNLTDMSDAEARRVLDFACGLTFGLRGRTERVTSRVFLLSPESVEVSGDVTSSHRGGLFSQG